ncbi:MAG: 16S rRNA (uracil(1498)-N(3))-methyltransferase [Kofleriaceae bacterium]|nr:16S rRNA (uracil(1498)-N(3))-methyltransferase [Kofleriaceae bacterium]
MRLLVPAAALAAGRAEVSGDDHHYLFRVRRLAPGAAVVVFDGEGHEADAVVEAVEAARATLRIGPARVEPAPRPRLTVIQGLIKGERMDWCVQKLVEVGVDEIVVVATARAVVRLDAARAASRTARLQAIAREAAKQARRATVPTVTLAPGGVAAAAAAADEELKLLCHPGAAASLGAHLGTAAASVVLLVGPEGGLAPEEVEAAASAGFEAVRLGATVLRAETAGVAAVAAFRIADTTTGNH